MVNGDVATVAGLIANPGPDGISLRESIEATNNDSGTYTIRFAPGLAEKTIEIEGSTLRPLTGGGVTVEGDIDGNDEPDVTVRATGALAHNLGAAGFQISSSRNHLHALRVEGFFTGVELRPINNPLPSHQTFADNTLSDLVIRDVRDGVRLTFYRLECGLAEPPPKPPCEPTTCGRTPQLHETPSRWESPAFTSISSATWMTAWKASP